MQEEALGNDGSFCYLDRGGGYMGINIYQNSELQCSHLMTQLAHFQVQSDVSQTAGRDPSL